MTKTVPEILKVGYHRTIGTGTIQTPGHSTLAQGRGAFYCMRG